MECSICVLTLSRFVDLSRQTTATDLSGSGPVRPRTFFRDSPYPLQLSCSIHPTYHSIRSYYFKSSMAMQLSTQQQMMQQSSCSSRRPFITHAARPHVRSSICRRTFKQNSADPVHFECRRRAQVVAHAAGQYWCVCGRCRGGGGWYCCRSPPDICVYPVVHPPYVGRGTHPWIVLHGQLRFARQEGGRGGG
jgi:hypothetical protein